MSPAEDTADLPRPTFRRILLLAVIAEAALLVILCLWLGYMHLQSANLLQPTITWIATISVVISVVAIGWMAFRMAWHRRFRFRLRTLLFAIFALSLVMTFLTTYVNQLWTRRLAENAISHIIVKTGVVSVGLPQGTSAQTPTDWTDLRNAVSIEFSGVPVNSSDFESLASVPALASLTIRNAPVDAKDFSRLARLPNLELLILENTGANDTTLKEIADINPKWHVFRNRDELRQWSLDRIRLNASY